MIGFRGARSLGAIYRPLVARTPDVVAPNLPGPRLPPPPPPASAGGGLLSGPWKWGIAAVAGVAVAYAFAQRKKSSAAPAAPAAPAPRPAPGPSARPEGSRRAPQTRERRPEGRPRHLRTSLTGATPADAEALAAAFSAAGVGARGTGADGTEIEVLAPITAIVDLVEHRPELRAHLATERRRGTMPTVEWEGGTYSLKSRSTPIPDLASMDRMEAIMWLNRNTRAKGYGRSNPLAGLGGVVSMRVGEAA